MIFTTIILTTSISLQHSEAANDKNMDFRFFNLPDEFICFLPAHPVLPVKQYTQGDRGSGPMSRMHNGA